MDQMRVLVTKNGRLESFPRTSLVIGSESYSIIRRISPLEKEPILRVVWCQRYPCVKRGTAAVLKGVTELGL